MQLAHITTYDAMQWNNFLFSCPIMRLKLHIVRSAILLRFCLTNANSHFMFRWPAKNCTRNIQNRFLYSFQSLSLRLVGFGSNSGQLIMYLYKAVPGHAVVLVSWRCATYLKFMFGSNMFILWPHLISALNDAKARSRGSCPSKVPWNAIIIAWSISPGADRVSPRVFQPRPSYTGPLAVTTKL